MRWTDFGIQNQLFDLSHLDQFDHVYLLSDGSSHCVTIRFSHHCFTDHPSPTDDPDSSFVIGKDRRTFDVQRWQLSQRLPQIIKTLETRYISHTDHQSFFTVELVNERGQPQDYEVYFEVTKDTKTKRLYLTVKSAYSRDPNRNTQRPKSRKIRLLVILRNAQQNKPIRRQ